MQGITAAFCVVKQVLFDIQVHIHPSSVNFQVNHYESPYLVYHEKVKTTKVHHYQIR